MKYVIADIHGCFAEFQELLEKLCFSSQDELYLLGDMVDRGPNPISVMQDIMQRPNVYPILGNHDYMASKVLRRFAVEITEKNAATQLTAADLQNYMYWSQDGGSVTARQFRQLDAEEQQDVLEYFEDCSLYETIQAGGKNYVLVHGDIHGYIPEKPLDTYALEDFLLYRADYGRNYFKKQDTYLVTGHTPTMLLRPDGQSLIYEQNGHIALDCGCVYGGKLAAYCLDTQEVFYVNAKQIYYP